MPLSQVVEPRTKSAMKTKIYGVKQKAVPCFNGYTSKWFVLHIFYQTKSSARVINETRRFVRQLIILACNYLKHQHTSRTVRINSFTSLMWKWDPFRSNNEMASTNSTCAQKTTATKCLRWPYKTRHFWNRKQWITFKIHWGGGRNTCWCIFAHRLALCIFIRPPGSTGNMLHEKWYQNMMARSLFSLAQFCCWAADSTQGICMLCAHFHVKN